MSGSALLGFPEVQLSAEAEPPAQGADLPSLEFLERLTRTVLLEAIRTAEKDTAVRKPDLKTSGVVPRRPTRRHNGLTDHCSGPQPMAILRRHVGLCSMRCESHQITAPRHPTRPRS